MINFIRRSFPGILVSNLFLLGVGAGIGISEEAKPKIEIVSMDIDIGEAHKGIISDFKAEVKNIGAGDLIVENVYSSCGCFEVTDSRWGNAKKLEQVIVKPGESIFIAVKLDTNKITGAFEKELHIISNDPENKHVTWKIKGVVLDSAASLPRSNTTDVPYPSVEAEKPTPGAKVIMFFYSPGCNECLEIKNKFFPALKEKHGDKIRIEEYNIDDSNSFAILLGLQDKYDKKAKKKFFNPRPPAVFSESKLLYGAKDIKNKLEGILCLK